MKHVICRHVVLSQEPEGPLAAWLEGFAAPLSGGWQQLPLRYVLVDFYWCWRRGLLSVSDTANLCSSYLPTGR